MPWLGNHGLWLAPTLFMVATLFMAARAVTPGCFFPMPDRAIGAAPGTR